MNGENLHPEMEGESSPTPEVRVRVCVEGTVPLDANPMDYIPNAITPIPTVDNRPGGFGGDDGVGDSRGELSGNADVSGADELGERGKEDSPGRGEHPDTNDSRAWTRGQTRTLTLKDIGEMQEWFRQGFNLEEVRQKLNFIGSHFDMRGEVKRHGWKVSRLLVPSKLKRVWGRGRRKLSEDELQMVDHWLSDEYSEAALVRMCNYHFHTGLKTSHDFAQLLLRSGYAWRYCLVKNK